MTLGNKKKFYDIHCHAMNLSHPNYIAFIRRFNIDLLVLFSPIIVLLKYSPFFGKEICERIERINNLLSVMENDIGSGFLMIESFLMEDIQSNKLTLKIGNTEFDKIVLTPLIMDFGYKHTKSACYYNKPPQKPVIEQVIDLFSGIKKYKDTTPFHLFEIYPFLGINTRNYDLQRIELMMHKYFDNYRGREEDFYNNMTGFDGNIDNMGSNYFSGVKVYPPLNFDPWPQGNHPDDIAERTKVEYLYEFCCAKNIPLTTHCSDGGFEVVDNPQRFTSPLKWEKVLKKYPSLKLNFGHFGKQERGFFKQTAWREKVIRLILGHENVYADFSCCAFDDGFYLYLENLIKKYTVVEQDKLKQKILFGTDFMINLMWTNSYNDYLKTFFNTRRFADFEKINFSSDNPHRYLFS